jgi:hypothetical protein
VKQRDDLISALRYAVMMRRYDKSLSDRFGNAHYARPRGGGSGESAIAKDVDFDLFG